MKKKPDPMKIGLVLAIPALPVVAIPGIVVLLVVGARNWLRWRYRSSQTSP